MRVPQAATLRQPGFEATTRRSKASLTLLFPTWLRRRNVGPRSEKKCRSLAWEKRRHQSYRGARGVVRLAPRTGRGMIEAIERQFAGDRMRAILCGCESCGHLWLVTGERAVSRRCPKCKARRWSVAAPEFEPPGPPYQRRVRSRAAINSTAITQQASPIEHPGGVRCRGCGMLFAN